MTLEAHSRVHFTVRQLPGIVQFSAAVRDEAVRLARSFGQKHRIDVWYSEGGSHRLLEAYRPRTSPGHPVRHAPVPGSEPAPRTAVAARTRR